MKRSGSNCRAIRASCGPASDKFEHGRDARKRWRGRRFRSNDQLGGGSMAASYEMPAGKRTSSSA